MPELLAGFTLKYHAPIDRSVITRRAYCCDACRSAVRSLAHSARQGFTSRSFVARLHNIIPQRLYCHSFAARTADESCCATQPAYIVVRENDTLDVFRAALAYSHVR